MAPSKPNDVEAFGAGLAQDIQEKHTLRERNHQAVPDTDRRRRTMDSGRKLLLALLVCCVVALGLASAHQGRSDCHEDASNVDIAVANVEHSSLSSLLASNSAESLRELLEKYVPERYRQQDSQIAKRQDNNATVSTAVTTAVTTLSSASTVATTTVQTQPSPTTTAATTPTSASVQTSVQTQTVVQTSVQTQDPATETVTAPQTPTPSETVASSGTSEVTTPSTSAPVSSAPAPSSSSSSSSEQRSVSVDSSTTTVTGASHPSNIKRHYPGHFQGDTDCGFIHKQDQNPGVIEESDHHIHINNARWGHLSRHTNLILLRRRRADGWLNDSAGRKPTD
ncbi:hypothetical protein LA080_006888 [Diaporthe eres]|nr:hypothetical protein LA080_006888 [Diaporthe eres]